MSVNIRNFREVEKRLAYLTNQSKETTKKVGTTLKVSNKMNAFFNSLIINLKDLLKNQSDISLWFFDEDIPTLTNKPTSEWSTSEYSKHYGDIFYSKRKGRIYKFDNDVWSELNDESLRKAMALTDSQLADNDNERKVFTVTPSPPYESGDWYIHKDGSLYICQIGRTEGSYVETDFISSVDYAGAVAEKTGNQTIITKGTVITESAEAVTYLDKATNTTSAISGDSIRTGSITSNNYVKNNVGTRINLNDGTIDTKNFKVDEYGNMSCSNANINGDLIVAGKGVLSVLCFSSMVWQLLGNGYYDYAAPDYYKIDIGVHIPENFIVTSAILTLQMYPIKWTYNSKSVTGYPRDINLFYESSKTNSTVTPKAIDLGSEVNDYILLTSNTNKLNCTGSSSQLVTYKSSDLKSFLSVGESTTFEVRSTSTAGSSTIWTEANDYNSSKAERTGYGRAMINVSGYLSTS